MRRFLERAEGRVAVVVAEIEGPTAALAILDDLDLGRYYLFHAIRADLLQRLGRSADADAAYKIAIAQTGNTAERAHLTLGKQRLPRDGRPDGSGLFGPGICPGLTRGSAWGAVSPPTLGG